MLTVRNNKGDKIMEYIILNNQIEMPILGLGVFQVPDKKECQ